MRRTTVTISAELESVLAESAAESMLRRALEEWLAEHGGSPSVLRSEGGRIRVMLQVAAEALGGRALDLGYRDMASVQASVDWDNAHVRVARDRAIRVEVMRWNAEESAEGPAVAEAGVGGG